MTVLSLTQGPMRELRSLIVNKEADLLAFEQTWRHQKLLYKLDRTFANFLSGDDVVLDDNTLDHGAVDE
jgi:hypothetical protein